ncbi:MAG: DnaD domain protein [Andreesenia angusta]|nr:DnaD domain protein [Andreesenia angusta]
MKFKLKDTEMELGYTAIENIFIDEFLPSADGRFVKVYLFAFRYAKTGKTNPNFDHAYIAKRLQLPISEVIEAWAYWEKMGVVKRVYNLEESEDLTSLDFDIVFNNLTELYINSALKANNNISDDIYEKDDINIIDQVVFANQNPVLSKMFKDIEYYLRRNLSPKEKNLIIESVNDYSMDPEVFSYAAEEADSKGKNRVNYMIGIIKNWYNDGVRTAEDAREHIMNMSPENYMGGCIKKDLGSSRVLMSSGEKILLKKWISDFGFDLDMILKACEYTGSTTEPSFAYIDSILKSWHENGIKTIKEASKYQEEYSMRKNKKREEYKNYSNKNDRNKSYNNKKIKTRFHNFEQKSSKYTNEELFDIWMGDRLRKK